MSDNGSETVTLAGLAPLPYWVAWQSELRRGGNTPTKVPYAPSGRGKAKAGVPATWGTLEAARARAASLPKPFELGGVGIEFCALHDGRSLGGVDLDTCRDPESGALEPWARSVVADFASYTEISPSGTGVKVFFLFGTEDHTAIRRALGTTPNGNLKFGASWTRKTGIDHPPAIELHTGNRYFTVTEQIQDGSTDVLREVPTAVLLHLIRATGPQFAAGLPLGKPETGQHTPRSDHDLDAEADAAIERQEVGPDLGSRPARKCNIAGQDTSRSVAAFRVGGQARRAGADFDTMCAAIRDDPETTAWYHEKGNANGGRELRRIWDKTDPFTGELVVPRGAPLVTAKQFVGRQHTLHASGDVPHRTIHHQNSSFYTWQHSHYDEHTPEEMRAGLYRFLDGAKTFDPDTGKLIRYDPTKNRVANVLEALAAETQLSRTHRPPVWLDGAPTGAPDPAAVLSCRNGLLDLSDYTLHPHTPALFSLNALPFDYVSDAAPPTAWLEFLDTIWPEDTAAKEVLQELFGLALTADTTHQKAFLIVGPKRSGKGTIARVLTEMLGAANVCSPTLSSLSMNFGLAPLIGKRLAIVSDARLSGKADQAVIAERILAITGEDGLTIDRKFRDAWTGKLDVRFLVLTNELPRLTDSSGALASRFIVLVMTRSFYGKEDRGLLEKLRPELPGILRWSLAGLERLKGRGHFVPPASAVEAVREMEDLGSPIGAFLRETCVVDASSAVRCDELYRVWGEWCRAHGRDHAGTTQVFGRDLGAAIPGLRVSQHRDKQGKLHRYYNGLGFSQDWLSRSDTRDHALCSPPDTRPNGPGPLRH